MDREGAARQLSRRSRASPRACMVSPGARSAPARLYVIDALGSLAIDIVIVPVETSSLYEAVAVKLAYR